MSGGERLWVADQRLLIQHDRNRMATASADPTSESLTEPLPGGRLKDEIGIEWQRGLHKFKVAMLTMGDRRDIIFSAAFWAGIRHRGRLIIKPSSQNDRNHKQTEAENGRSARR